MWSAGGTLRSEGLCTHKAHAEFQTPEAMVLEVKLWEGSSS